MFTIQATTNQGTTYCGQFDNEDVAWSTAAALKLGQPALTLDVVPVPDGVVPAAQQPVFL